MLALRTSLPCGRRVMAATLATASRNNTLRTSYGFKKQIDKIAPISRMRLEQKSWYSTDKRPSQGEGELVRVYYGTLASRMKAVKFFSLTTSLAGIAAQPVLMEQGMKIGGTGMAVFFCTVAGFFTFVTPLLLHFITKKYVTELHYNPATDEYTATTVSLLLYKIQTKFRTSDVVVPDVPGMFTSFVVGKRPLFVDPSLFDDPEHYVRIMGYDKPIDFKLDLKEEPAKTKEQQQK